jgi:hypothetical protein
MPLGDSIIRAPAYLGLTVSAYVLGSHLPAGLKLFMPPVFTVRAVL